MKIGLTFWTHAAYWQEPLIFFSDLILKKNDQRICIVILLFQDVIPKLKEAADISETEEEPISLKLDTYPIRRQPAQSSQNSLSKINVHTIVRKTP